MVYHGVRYGVTGGDPWGAPRGTPRLNVGDIRGVCLFDRRDDP